MTKRIVLVLVGVCAAPLLGGCEVLIPLLIASNSGSGSDPYADPYADPYYDYGYYEELDVEVEQLSGQVGGQTLTPPMGALDVGGYQSGSSANFALTSVPEMMEPAAEDVYVTLDVCPIDEYANGGPISDPSASYLNLIVCQGGECLDAYDSDLDVEVTDDGSGRRRVTTHATWSDGSVVDLAVRYTVPAR